MAKIKRKCYACILFDDKNYRKLSCPGLVTKTILDKLSVNGTIKIPLKTLLHRKN
jgi:hypothetical protein